MRLNKYLAQAGVASRRKADELILSGNVYVDGKLVTEPYIDVDFGAKIKVKGREIEAAPKKVYLILNKPKGYITTTSDEKDRPTVMELVRDASGRVFPVGRLDGQTTGLLIMTNDGEFANRIMNPKYEKIKTYRAYVTGVVSREKLGKLRRGVDIGGYITGAAEARVVKQGAGSAVVEIAIREGKNRQVRKMLAAVGCRVMELERIAIGPVKLGRLKPGHFRKMTRSEIELLSGE